MKYRSDIDGLRALSVCAVILFHAGIVGFEGGFVGVDVFLVISGFLITRFILADLQIGQFEIGRFLLRRIRRLLPALYVMLVVTLIFAYIFLGSNHLEPFLSSFASSVLFYSNVHFWKGGGYFTPQLQSDPLVHTWSLSLEVQFYLAISLGLPIIYMIAARKIRSILLLGTLGMFTFAVWASYRYTAASYFLLPTRLWEFFIGASAGAISLNRNVCVHPIVSLTALIAVLASFLVFNESLPWPGLFAAIPVSAVAVLLVDNNPRSYTKKILSLRPLPLIGLISYSLYLWHQPVLGFYETIVPYYAQSNVHLVPLLVLIFTLSSVSYMFVEQRARRVTTWRLLVIMSSPVIAFGAAIAVFGAMAAPPSKLFMNDGQMAVERALEQNIHKECLASGYEAKLLNEPCRRTTPNAQAKIGVLGDSHALLIFEALAQRGGDKFDLTFFGAGRCPPFWTQKTTYPCFAFQKTAAELLVKNYQVNLVVLAARWSEYFENTEYNNGLGVVREPFPFVTDLHGGSVEGRRKFATERLANTIDYFSDRGIKVLFVDSVPYAGIYVRDELHKVLRFRNIDHEIRKHFQLPRAAHAQRNRAVRNAIALAKAQRSIHIFDPAATLCNHGYCALLDTEGMPIIGDDNHLSAIGLEAIADQLYEKLKYALALTESQ